MSRSPADESPSLLRPELPEQPLSRRAAVALAVAPVLVLLALTLVIGDVLPIDIGFVGVAVGIGWLVFEMHCYQREVARAEAVNQPAPASDFPGGA